MNQALNLGGFGLCLVFLNDTKRDKKPPTDQLLGSLVQMHDNCSHLW